MIVNYTESGWEIVTQRCHGLLAAQLAYHWDEKTRPARWVETLLAIAEHDDAEVELDGENLLTAQGGPLNFNMKTFNLAHCRQLALLTITKSRYLSLLVSMHMDFLYRGDKASIPAARAFLKEQANHRARLRKALGITLEQAEKLYCFVEWFDACSLIICQRQMPPEQRSVEISHGADKVRYQLIQLDDSALTVVPWPFQIPDFDVSFESRLIKKGNFKTSAEFRKSFLKAPIKETIWKIRQSGIPLKEKMKTI